MSATVPATVPATGASASAYRRRVRPVGIALVALAVLTNIATKVVNFSLGEYGTPELAVRAVLNVQLGVVYALCALVAWSLVRSRRVGWIMLLVSFTWEAGSWLRSAGDDGWLWPVLAGLTQLWAIFVGLLVFCYPSGRLTGRADRVITAIAVAVFSVRFLSTVLLDGPAGDTAPSAPNAYAVVALPRTAAIIEDVWFLTGLALLVTVAVRTLARWVRSSPPARRVAYIMPAALIAWAVCTVYEVVSRVSDLPAIGWLSFLTPLAISVIPIAFVAGILHVRALRSRVSDLVAVARQGIDPLVWEHSLQSTLGDRSLRVYWWDAASNGYRDSAGEVVDPGRDPGRGPGRELGRELGHDSGRDPGGAPGRGSGRTSPASSSGRSLLRIETGDSPLAIIDHDVVLTENTRLLDAVAGAVRLSVDNDRLRSALEKTLDDVRESRRRLLEAGDAARARIERDLHDGSQQSLVSLAISLRMIEGRARAEGEAAIAQELDRASTQLADALAELRALARGIHPTSLTEGGLRVAIRELAARSPVPVEVDVAFPGRAPRLVESTVYFVVAECLTNTAKHARASRAWVRLAQEDDTLTFSIADDGVGIDDPVGGSGLRGMRDRVETIGGRLSIGSEPSGGTRVAGAVPLTADP